MPRFPLSRLSLSLPALLLAQTAMADVTAAQVWGDWKKYMQDMGYAMTATETANGADMAISGISMSMELPENGGQMTMSMGDITFVQDGGAVNVVMPDTMPITLNVTPNGAGEAVTMAFTYAQTGHNLRASGDPDQMTYDYSADTAVMNLQELVIDGESFGEQNAKVNVTANQITSTTTMTQAEMRTYVQSGAIEGLTYDIKIDNPEEPVKVAMNGGITGVAFDGGGSIPLAPDYADVAAMLKSGFAVDGSFNYASGNTQMNVTDPTSGDFAATTSSEGGTLTVKMGADQLAYGGTQKNVQMNVQVAELPFPVQLSMAEGGFNLAMPISASDDPQGFAFGINLGDFVMSDLIWSIFDPAAQLPRDPATVTLDLSGQAKMLVDLMDPESAASTPVPGELQALTIGTLLVDAVGARLEGSGDFTFDNSDMVTFNGMPKPVGAVNLSLAGGNALMDKLVAMGLLPEEQAMGARMMMGLFAVPGDAPDTLKSTVEFNAEGQVLANGQRIR